MTTNCMVSPRHEDYPWDCEIEIPERDFEIEVEYVLRRKATVSTINYNLREPDEYEGDEFEDYENEFLTPLQMLKDYARMCQEKLENATARERYILKDKIASAQAWVQEQGVII